MTHANDKAIEKVFDGISNKDEIIDALRHQDRSYLKGVVQWYDRHPKNPFLVKFLKKALQSWPYGASRRS